MVKDIHDVITQAKFGDDRLRGSGVVAGQISEFSIDFAGRPYNTLTLPCERVIPGFVPRHHVAYTTLYECRLFHCDFSVTIVSTQEAQLSPRDRAMRRVS